MLAFLDAKFSKNRRVSLGALTTRITSGSVIPRGTLVVMASGDRKIRLKILERDTPHRGFSEPLIVNGFGAEHKVTPHYLLWYLSQEPVTIHMLAQASGAVFVRVPRKVLHAIPVPLPTSVTKIKPVNEFSVTRTETPFSRLIADLNNDYLLNVANGRYRTAAVLAGAICEVILYQLLIEQGVSPKLLRDDRGLGFNKLLEYVELLKLDGLPGFPKSQLVQMKKLRNDSVHAGLLVNKMREVAATDLDCFNSIIKHFGI
jgi:hypothetical protein